MCVLLQLVSVDLGKVIFYIFLYQRVVCLHDQSCDTYKQVYFGFNGLLLTLSLFSQNYNCDSED
jgi:hypothetical protein